MVSDSLHYIFITDVNIIYNHIWAIKEFSNGENWTTICMPGCSEEYMLNIYTYFKY